MRDWSLTSPMENHIKIGENVINRGHDCRTRTTDEMIAEIEARAQLVDA